MNCGSDKPRNPEEILLLDILEGEEYPGSLPLDAGEERYMKELTHYYLRKVSGNEVDYTTVVQPPTLSLQRPSFPGAIRTLVRLRDYLRFHNDLDSPNESDDPENAADLVEDLSGAFELVKLGPLTPCCSFKSRAHFLSVIETSPKSCEPPS